MQDYPIEDQLNRSVKLAMDSGEVGTIEEAYEKFQGYRLYIHVGPETQGSITHQAALVTAVNTARRCFLGGVLVGGGVSCKCVLPWPSARTLGDAVNLLGGKIVEGQPDQLPLISIGSYSRPKSAEMFGVRATFEGWSAGAIPLEDDTFLPERQQFVPSGVLAAAIAVSEAFQFVRGSNGLAGKRRTGISLWRPGESFLDLQENVGPRASRIPARLWIIGLGHIGQAIMWTLGLLPYSNPSKADFVLQDHDSIVPANVSTSLLTDHEQIGKRKTRVISAWCESRGFSNSMIERKFGSDVRIQSEDPRIAICGVHDSITRANLGDACFHRILEAGIGTGFEEYLAFQVHGFPASKSPREKWGGRVDIVHSLPDKPAYKALGDQLGIDQCGLERLAGKAVGVPFVGAAIAGTLVSELFRMCLTDERYELIDGSLRSLDHLQAIKCPASDVYNPESTEILI